MPVLAFIAPTIDADETRLWIAALTASMPDLEVRVWPKDAPKETVDFALVWRQPPGVLLDYPYLKAVFSLGAGVEHVLSDPHLPRHLPLVRMVDPSLRSGMVEFVLLRVLHYHRDMPIFEAQQRQRTWKQHFQPLPTERRVGILGLGELGGACARAVAALGFDVGGWSRRKKEIAGVRSHTGEDGLFELLERSHIVVCLLPLTPDTEDMLDATAFGAMPRGAYLINVGRGRHVVDDDLIEALDSGHLAGATLDVFRTEPLTSAHAFWTHPKITVIPHNSALTLPRTAALTVVDNIRRHLHGEPMQNVVDRKNGY